MTTDQGEDANSIAGSHCVQTTRGQEGAASGTANQRAVIVFRYDGTYWYQVGTSGWVT